MNVDELNQAHEAPEKDFDLFRLNKSKQAVDLSANTLRAYNKRGLPFYGKGKIVFVSRADLRRFLTESPLPARGQS
ncbi:MAG: hypothetical protein JWM16_5658 [Verrucomicrobiales bacterium]|nr:hypothetical protein [Verrucomicrobiales bacterium]